MITLTPIGIACPQRPEHHLAALSPARRVASLGEAFSGHGELLCAFRGCAPFRTDEVARFTNTLFRRLLAIYWKVPDLGEFGEAMPTGGPPASDYTVDYGDDFGNL